MHHWIGKIGLTLLMALLLFHAPAVLAQIPAPSAPSVSPGPASPSAPHLGPQVQPGPSSQGMQAGPRAQAGPGGQQPLEYAFRPDLSNPEFGMCLKLEKNWKALWDNYYQLYHQIRMMSPQDPRYGQMTYYANMVKSQLDSAWHDFSSKCVYFPQR